MIALLNDLPDLPGPCQETDPETFHPHPGDLRTLYAAKAICGACPFKVRERCLAYALANDTLTGVWAGTTEDDRARMRREQYIDRAPRTRVKVS